MVNLRVTTLVVHCHDVEMGGPLEGDGERRKEEVFENLILLLLSLNPLITSVVLSNGFQS